MPKGCKWTKQWAKKKNRMGRAMGGMMVGVREEMVGEDEGEVGKEEGVMVTNVGRGRRSGQ